MMKKLALAVAIVSLGAVALIATAIAKNGNGGGRSFSAKLSGYEEIIPASFSAGPPASFTGEAGAVSTVGRGSFSARLRDDPLRIEYRLRYQNLEGATTTQAHIHFGQKHTVGGVSAFLCGGSPPASDKPACDPDSDTIEGTIDAADVIGPAGQGIAATELPELIRAMRNGATYANVHTNLYPGGEIRGQIDHGRHHGRGNGKGRDEDD
jgi:CHRD domain-containing protein